MSSVSDPLEVDSIIPLAGNGVFAGPWINLQGQPYGYLVGVSSSDKTGTLYVEQSIDGVHITEGESLATKTDPSTGGQTSLLKVAIACQYCRVRYVNGATTQTTFILARRLQLA